MKIALLAAIAALLLPTLAQAADASDCHIGAYRLADGGVVTIDLSTDKALRWHRLDGTTGALHPGADGVWSSTLGWTDRPDGKTVSFSDCAAGDMVFDKTPGHRIAFDTADTAFDGKGVKLAGRLVLPKGQGPVPVVVLVHGSENYSGRDFYILQRLLPAEGVGVFVYDKRGTGRSTGQYTQDFSLLADDAVAAVAEARGMAGPRAGRVGFQGGSQGGYVAPLAATRTKVDFVIVGFGLTVSPIEEDREEIVLEMKLKHHSDAEIAKALQVADAAATIVTSSFTKGFDRFDALRAKYRSEPWYKDLHGNFTVDLLPYNAAELHARASQFLVGTPMTYDAMPVLRRLNTPQLWELGADDLAAPSAETARRLKRLGAAGRPITLAMFPRAQHGIYEFETKPDGTRVLTRNAEGYFAMMRDFARDGRLHGTYGASVVTAPR
jgi:pimeloyl-ACP methyl ester carboxylesterase